MAHHKSAKKRIKTNLKSAANNRHYKSKMKTAIKKVIQTEDRAVAEENLKGAVSLLDKLATKKLIHKNKAANQKSRLVKHVNKLGG
ncbi:30S ribosomal protein S20 [candidate division KSB1 bacterium]|nr:30S ribosomal protein S20 [candidate division KSB1 bacterium]